MGRPLISLALVVLALSATGAASAQTDEAQPPAGYDHVIDQAVAEFGASHWEEARALFLQGHQMFPNARTLRGIGMSSYELRDYPEAVQALDDALASAVRPLTPEQRTQVSELRERAAAFVGRYEVPAAPAGARFYLDDAHVDVEGWPASAGHVLIGIGEHQVAIRLEDGRATSARIVVRGHTDGPLDIDLAPLAPATVATTSTTEPPPQYGTVPPPPPGPDLTPWIVMGVGLGVAVVGGVLLGVGYADIGTVQNAAGGTSWSSLSGAYDRAPIETGVGGAALGVGLGAALVGLIWGVASSSPTSARDERLVVDLGVGSLVLRGAF